MFSKTLLLLCVAVPAVLAHNWLKTPATRNGNEAATNKPCPRARDDYVALALDPRSTFETKWTQNHGGDNHWIKIVSASAAAKVEDMDTVANGGLEYYEEYQKTTKTATITAPSTPGAYILQYGWNGYRNCVDLNVATIISWGFDVGGASRTIHVGDTVKWKFDQDSQKHDVQSGVNRVPDGKFASALQDKGTEFSFTFNEVGEFSYFCTPHDNMNAKITVLPAETGINVPVDKPVDGPPVDKPSDVPTDPCPTLERPSKAVENKCEGYARGSTCTFTCKTGYQATNQGTRTCHDDGTWGGDELKCEKVYCPDLEPPTNGMGDSCKDRSEGKECRFSCKDGYTDNGYTSRTCHLGEWVGENLVCSNQFCPLLQVPDGAAGEVCVHKIQGDKCFFSCKKGVAYKGSGSPERICEGGEWTGDAYACSVTGTCPQLSSPPGATYQNCVGKGEGDNCEFTCEPGYEVSGSAQRTCTKQNGKLMWTGEEFKCNGKQCASLPSPANAVPKTCEGDNGDECTFSCETGFSDNGFAKRTCIGGQWNGEALVCAPKTCHMLSVPAYADGSECNGGTCKFTCQDGFVANGDATRVCKNGAWSGFSLKCINEGYTYVASAWSPCSKECGSGKQSRTVKCVDAEKNKEVDDDFCDDLHPIDEEQKCNEEECVIYTWKGGEYGVCSIPCGIGQQRRDITCEAKHAGSAVGATVAPEQCSKSGMAPPKATRVCGSGVCTENHWTTGFWTPCSKSCGGGTQDRTVGCRDPKGNKIESDQCTESKPITTQECGASGCDGVTYTWKVCAWETCTAECGGGGALSGVMAGTRNRDIVCIDADKNEVPDAACAMAGVKEATIAIGCNSQPCCHTNWMTTPWSRCQAGERIRTTHCHDIDGSNAEDDDCNHRAKPITEESCDNDATCQEPGESRAGRLDCEMAISAASKAHASTTLIALVAVIAVVWCA